MDLSLTEQQLIAKIRERAAKLARRKDRTPRIWIYIRFSHADSRESGLTVDAQVRLCREYAEKLLPDMPEGTRVVRPLIDDAVKASKVPFRRRRAGRIIWERIIPGDALVVYKMDRWARDMADMTFSLQKLTAKEVGIHFVRDNVYYRPDAMTRMQVNMLGTFAQFFSDQLSARAKDVADEMRKRGCHNGRPRVWEAYVGEKGWKKRFVIPKLWQTAVMIWVARERHGWSWVTISGWVESVLAKEEQREPILGKHYTARKWSPRRCGNAYKEMKTVRWRAPSLRQALEQLVASDIPLDQVGRHCPPAVPRPKVAVLEEDQS